MDLSITAMAEALWLCCVKEASTGWKPLAIVSSVCRTCRKTVHARVKMRYKTLLQTLAESLSASELQQRHVNMVTWLSSVVGQQQLLIAAKQLKCPSIAFAMHDVPFKTAMKFVKKGFRVTTKQLLAAAQCRVSGLGVWVQAGRQQDVAFMTGTLSDVTGSICLGDMVSMTSSNRPDNPLQACANTAWRCSWPPAQGGGCAPSQRICT